MYVLGISAYYHDSAAALFKDGKMLVAFEEERFTRVKHDNSFPSYAIKACLENEGITEKDINIVAYYEKPLLKFERILETFIETYPFSIKSFIKAMPEWLSKKINIESTIRKRMGYKGRILFVPHHLSHAAAAYYTSAFKKAAILTIDGSGEYQTTALWSTKEHEIKPLKEIVFPDSIGLFYSTFTAFLGFRVNDDEYKVMGMAAYGEPKYTEKIRELIELKDDGSFKLNMTYFSYRESSRMWTSKFEGLFGKPRMKKDKISKRHMNIAASIQLITEEVYFKMLNHLYFISKSRNLCIGGGVALNSLANGKIHENTPFKKVFVFGPAGDSGGAIGAALYVSRTKSYKFNISNDIRIGNSYTNKSIKKILDHKKLKYKSYHNQEQLTNEAARLLVKGNILGWFQNKMEFGPRALGSRSILAAPYPRSMKEIVNVVKKREQFRPFAGSVIEEKAHEFFNLPKSQRSFPFMNFCFTVRKRELIPAITHEDGTCRIQTVGKNYGTYRLLIEKFYKKTKIPVILNTSFNIKGEPIVESPEQAIRDFSRTKMDSLVIGSFIVYKKRD